jgi:hypothetical protein
LPLSLYGRIVASTPASPSIAHHAPASFFPRRESSRASPQLCATNNDTAQHTQEQGHKITAKMHVRSTSRPETRSYGRMAESTTQQMAKQNTPALAALHWCHDILHGMLDLYHIRTSHTNLPSGQMTLSKPKPPPSHKKTSSSSAKTASQNNPPCAYAWSNS